LRTASHYWCSCDDRALLTITMFLTNGRQVPFSHNASVALTMWFETSCELASFVSLQQSFKDDDSIVYEVNNINHSSFCNTVIRKWSHAISKYNEATPGSFFPPEITFKMYFIDYPASANSPIHPSHFDADGLRCVHTCCPLTEWTKHSVKTFSVFTATGHYTEASDQIPAAQSATVCFIHTEKGYTVFKEIPYPSESVKQVPVKIWATCFPSRVIRLHYKTTTRIWNQMSTTTHAGKGKENVNDTHWPRLAALWCTQNQRVPKDYWACHTQSQT
jgi:hypothetical protein